MVITKCISFRHLLLHIKTPASVLDTYILDTYIYNNYTYIVLDTYITKDELRPCNGNVNQSSTNNTNVHAHTRKEIVFTILRLIFYQTKF